MTLPATFATPLLWLDATDNTTITKDSYGYVTEWASKDANSRVAISNTTAFATSYTTVPNSTNRLWTQSTISANGRVIVLVPSDTSADALVVSNDYGKTWNVTLSDLASHVNEVSVSDSGQVIVLGADSDNIYVSMDFGQTFVARNTDAPRLWEWTSISATGKYMLATGFQEPYVWKSSDFGQHWVVEYELPTSGETAGFVYISKKNPDIQFCGYFPGPVKMTVNRGSTWTTVSGLPTNAYWYDMRESRDSPYMLLYSNPGFLYLSTNNGSTWTRIIDTTERGWVSAGMSDDGSIMVAAAENDTLYVSTDVGSTWTQKSSARPWSDVNVSADGTRVIASSNIIVSSIDSGQTFSTAVPSVQTPSTSVMSSNGKVVSYTSYTAGAYSSVSTLATTTTAFTKQWIDFDVANYSIADVTVGTNCTIFAVFDVTDNNKGALFSVDTDHVFYPRNGNKSQINYGGGLLTRAPSTIKIGEKYVFSVVIESDDLQMYINRDMTMDTASYTPTDPVGTLTLGSDTNGNFYTGLLGELIIYNGNLRESTDWNTIMSYLSSRWAIPDAYPLLVSIGSDPHLTTLSGKRFDIMKAGTYDFVQVKDFRISFKTAYVKSLSGLYIEKVEIHNGNLKADVNFNKRSLKISGWDTVKTLNEDLSDHIKWDIFPRSPKRLVKVLYGYHPTIGHFWLRLDFKHRYIIPYMPYVKNWNKLEDASGLILNKKSTKNVQTNHKTLRDPQVNFVEN